MELAPCKGEAGFRNPLNFCSWNLESWTLESGIQFKGSGIPLTIGVGNPSSTDREFQELSTWNPESKTLSWIPLHRANGTDRITQYRWVLFSWNLTNVVVIRCCYFLVFLRYMLQPIRIRLTTLSCFETNIYLGVVLHTHASKPVSDPQTKIICKQTLLISLFALYKLSLKLRLDGDQNTQYRMRQTFCFKRQLNAHYDKISHAVG